VPALEAHGIRNTGALNLGGSIATAGGLVFIAATNDSRFRAFESRTGRLLWDEPIDANGHTIPITYTGRNGKQYVAIMAGGGGGYFGGTPSDAVVAFALDAKGEVPGHIAASAVPAQSVTPERVKHSGPVTLPEGPGKILVQRTCGGACHGLDTVTGVRRDRAAWTAMVDNMVARGAKAKDNEIKAIIDYLVQNFGK
jgi:quinoprotein glucose dehydrogenase